MRNRNSESGKVGLIVVGVIAVIVLGFGACALSYRSDCVRAEAGIKAQYKQNQNNYDNMWKKFKEMAQVSDKYAGDLKELYDNTMKGRYGEGGSKAMFQWLKEQNPTLDPTVYTKLQAAIEAGRNSFESNQRTLIDRKNAYEVVLNENRALAVGFLFGFPKIDLDKYDIVTSGTTDEAFETKQAEEVDLFK